MVESVIVCAPLFDEVTEYCFEESRDLIEYAEKKGVKIYDQPDEQAVRENLEKAIHDHPEALIYHTDHGSPDKAWGDDDRPVLDLKNVKILAGKDAYMNNCSSAQELGKKAYQEGCLAYWGNTDVVSFTTDAWEDFKESFLHGLKLRIRGYIWKECLEKTREKMTQLVDKLLAEGKVLAAACMRSNRDSLVCYTPDMPPQSDCPARRLAIRMVGPKIGWKLSRTFPFSVAFFALGMFMLGVLGHDFAHQVWELKGTVFSVEGGYAGLIGATMFFILSFILLTRNYWRALKSC